MNELEKAKINAPGTNDSVTSGRIPDLEANTSARMDKVPKETKPKTRPAFRFPRLRKIEPKSSPASLVRTSMGKTMARNWVNLSVTTS